MFCVWTFPISKPLEAAIRQRICLHINCLGLGFVSDSSGVVCCSFMGRLWLACDWSCVVVVVSIVLSSEIESRSSISCDVCICCVMAVPYIVLR